MLRWIALPLLILTWPFLGLPQSVTTWRARRRLRAYGPITLLQ